jgi:hypothetical protein
MRDIQISLPVTDPMYRHKDPAVPVTIQDQINGFDFNKTLDKFHAAGLAYLPRPCEYVIMAVPIGHAEEICERINETGKT